MLKKNEKNDYIGIAGQLSVMSEFAYRGYNVAIPEIDKGDDVFVFNDLTGEMWRVQVKTASKGRPFDSSIMYQYNVKKLQLTTPQNPDLHFIFAMRSHTSWRFFIIARNVLQNYNLGSPTTDRGKDRVTIPLTLHSDGRLTGKSKTDLSEYLENWSTWPNLINQSVDK